jgi:hypothetical protein
VAHPFLQSLNRRSALSPDLPDVSVTRDDKYFLPSILISPDSGWSVRKYLWQVCLSFPSAQPPFGATCHFCQRIVVADAKDLKRRRHSTALCDLMRAFRGYPLSQSLVQPAFGNSCQMLNMLPDRSKILQVGHLIPLHEGYQALCPRFAQRRPTTPSNIVVHPCPPLRRIHPMSIAICWM